MKIFRLIAATIPALAITWAFLAFSQSESSTADSGFLTYVVDPAQSDLRFFLKDESGVHYTNLKNLKADLEQRGLNLLFGMNGGMYTRSLDPQGLYVEQGKVISPLDTVKEGYGNFYLQPNGVFYLTRDKQAFVKTTSQFQLDNTVYYATQSGPMLLIGGKIHPKFKKGSSHLNVRNGVGILPDGQILFALSKEEVNLYDFATFFKQQGCQDALYLDGFVSKAYLPEKNWIQLEGTLGVLIGEVQ